MFVCGWCICRGARMAGLLGDERRFAVEVGDGSVLRRVDLWVAGQWVTCEGGRVFVEQFCSCVACIVAVVRAGGIPARPFAGASSAAAHRRLRCGFVGGGREFERFGFFRRWGWGPADDSVASFLWWDEGCLVIAMGFWRERHLLTRPG